ncbi:MAG: hypothetical protein NTV94_03400 [Planctomycetota bacterium]|nr:hypothetical protein [Planctomycetota bacterium]
MAEQKMDMCSPLAFGLLIVLSDSLVAILESGQRLTHQLRLVDEATPTRCIARRRRASRS